MVRFGVSGIFAAGLLAGGAFAASGTGEQRGNWGGGQQDAACTVYEHANYGGERWALGRNESHASVGRRWNDRISSVECRPGCVLVAHEDVNFRGRQARYEGQTRFVGPQWNDRISALRVECRGGNWGGDRPGRPGGPGGSGGPGWGSREPACTIYENANFSGRREEIRDGAIVPSIGREWNDRISSLECRPGCTFTAYEHVNWQGRSVQWRDRIGYVGPQWNDRVSGYRVQCR